MVMSCCLASQMMEQIIPRKGRKISVVLSLTIRIKRGDTRCQIFRLCAANQHHKGFWSFDDFSDSRSFCASETPSDLIKPERTRHLDYSCMK